MTTWFRLTLVCCILLCLFLSLTQAVDSKPPVVGLGYDSIEDQIRIRRAHQFSCQKHGFDLARAGPFGSLVLNCALTVGNIGPPGWENHGPPEPIGSWRVAGQTGNSNQHPRAPFSANLLAQTTHFKTSGFRNSL